MSTTFIILPDFLLILTGLSLARLMGLEPPFWSGLEKLIYFVLFPALLFRSLRLLPWTLEARTYPWGRRFPPIVFAYEVRGREETELALADLAAALVRGDGAPAVAGAERIR